MNHLHQNKVSYAYRQRQSNSCTDLSVNLAKETHSICALPYAVGPMVPLWQALYAFTLEAILDPNEINIPSVDAVPSSLSHHFHHIYKRQLQSSRIFGSLLALIEIESTHVVRNSSFQFILGSVLIFLFLFSQLPCSENVYSYLFSCYFIWYGHSNIFQICCFYQ